MTTLERQLLTSILEGIVNPNITITSEDVEMFITKSKEKIKRLHNLKTLQLSQLSQRKLALDSLNEKQSSVENNHLFNLESQLFIAIQDFNCNKQNKIDDLMKRIKLGIVEHNPALIMRLLYDLEFIENANSDIVIKQLQEEIETIQFGDITELTFYSKQRQTEELDMEITRLSNEIQLLDNLN